MIAHIGKTTTDRVARISGGIALVGIAMIAVTCVAVQFLRTDLDWISTAMSLYVYGPYGDWVRASFYAPAPGIALVGIGWHRTLDRRARNVAPAFLFAIAATGLCVLASFSADAGPAPVTFHGLVHQWATFGTFVFLTTAMVVQSWQMRGDPHWRSRFRFTIALAATCVVYFWIFALVKPIPRGLGEKVVIALVLAWLWRAAWLLVRGG